MTHKVIGAMIAVFLALHASAALSCTSTQKWQRIPSEKAVEMSTAIHLAKISQIEAGDGDSLDVRMDVLETLKGRKQRNLLLNFPIVVAIHHLDRETDPVHLSDRFWEGKQSNTLLTPACRFSPVEYYDGGVYLVLLRNGHVDTQFGFERIVEPSNDLWYEFVSSQFD